MLSTGGGHQTEPHKIVNMRCNNSPKEGRTDTIKGKRFFPESAMLREGVGRQTKPHGFVDMYCHHSKP